MDPSDHLPQHVAWRLFLTVHALAVRGIDQGLRDHAPLSLDDYDVLLTLQEAPDGSLRMSELAEAVLLSNGGMTRRVARLLEKGYLKKTQSLDDARVFRVGLTRRGRRALEASWVAYRPLIESHFATHLSDAEARQFGEWMQRLLDHLGGPAHRGLLERQVTDAPQSPA
ncbi:DNA-binding MarR family transcriptional regulator [Haloferula luteola]|uniref:DNA-binding MarR family transcriptional regulator n=1 Tax=Haloferula luteola TaxID=595692 RepID=A0A840VAE7_9BACT|nr:MarR family transcriptional regulator [Haloferula luteola]MBB5350920.1 DNA-binding MarR family transcriptional regulator [Haloferula luteola]